jgi:hypothetical protein
VTDVGLKPMKSHFAPAPWPATLVKRAGCHSGSFAYGNAVLRDELLVSSTEEPMKKLIAVTAFAPLCGAAFAQNTGPAPQSGMEKPGTTNGAKPDGTMDTTGMNSTKGNIKRNKDGAPAPVKQDDMKK